MLTIYGLANLAKLHAQPQAHDARRQHLVDEAGARDSEVGLAAQHGAGVEQVEGLQTEGQRPRAQGDLMVQPPVQSEAPGVRSMDTRLV